MWKFLAGKPPGRDEVAQTALWRRLCARQLGNFDFRRRHKVDGMVFDFACKELSLGVVLYDSNAVAPGIDQDLEARLTEADWTIMRFSYDEILDDIEPVLARLEDMAMSLRWE